jgi:hypothetical protein
VNQVIGAPAAPVFAVPTVLDLPVTTGIREAKPAEPVVYVLNEGEPARRERLGRQDRVLTTGSIAGPRIISRGEEGWDVDASSPSGARIIHLAVPVGRRN